MLHEGEESSSRKLVHIEGQSFRGWGCSECAWVFNPAGPPVGNSLDEMTRNFQMQLSRRVCVTCLRPASSGQSGEGFRVVSHAVLGARVNANRLSELVATQNSDCSSVAEEFGLTV
jgi:hypothetical protein